jgi:hypothetical protein
MVRGTADPSAALGMTKGRATLPSRAVAGRKAFFIIVGGPQDLTILLQYVSVVEEHAVLFTITRT